MNLNLPPAFLGLAPLMAWALAILTIVIHIVFAVGVWSDGSKFESKNGRTRLAPFSIWAAATLIGGVFVGGLYYFLHHSKFFEEQT
ncbi:MAG: hypothetical protein ABIQ35_11755 [Verrucomicrobiota bacterium]